MVGSIGRFVAAKGQKVLQLGCVETRDGMLCFWCSDKKTVASHRVEWLQRQRERERERERERREREREREREKERERELAQVLHPCSEGL